MSEDSPQEQLEGSLDPEVSESAAYRRERRQRTLVSDRRRSQFLLAGVIGLLSGLLAVGFQWAIYAVEQGRTELIEMLSGIPWAVWIVVPILCATLGLGAGWLSTKFAPETAGSGIPHVKAVLLRLRPFHWLRVIVVKIVGGLLAMGGGLSLGREGPTVQMGAAVGEGIAKATRASKRSETHLVSCGAGAGLAAAFNAPLSGFLFVIEELQRELSPLTYGTALIASVVGNVVARFLTGQLPSFMVEDHATLPLASIPVVILIGLLCGVIGVVWNGTLLGSQTVFTKISWLKPKHRPAFAGLIGGILLLTPLAGATGGGHHLAEQVIGGHYSGMDMIGFLVMLFAVKLIFTGLSYGSGAPGGIFAPMLVVGAMVGYLGGEGLLPIFSYLNVDAGMFAMIGMAGLFAASVRAPLTGVILVVEMTGNYDLLLYLLLACFTASITAEKLKGKPIYEELLARDLRRSSDVEVDIPEDEPLLEDIVVEAGSKLDGTLIKDAGLPIGCLIVTLKRLGAEMVPSGQTTLQRGDEVTVVVAGAALKRMNEIHALFLGEL
jgi:CIC family chloride channel protein